MLSMGPRSNRRNFICISVAIPSGRHTLLHTCPSLYGASSAPCDRWIQQNLSKQDGIPSLTFAHSDITEGPPSLCIHNSGLCTDRSYCKCLSFSDGGMVVPVGGGKSDCTFCLSSSPSPAASSGG